MPVKSELQEAFAVAAAIPKLHADAVERLNALLSRVPVSTIHTLCDAIEKHSNGYPVDLSAIMKAYGVKLRVALWEVRDGRCFHAEVGERTLYEVGNTKMAEIKDVDTDGRWISAWIA